MKGWKQINPRMIQLGNWIIERIREGREHRYSLLTSGTGKAPPAVVDGPFANLSQAFASCARRRANEASRAN